MTALIPNKDWTETKEEITNWFIFNDFENIIQKYDNKEIGWLWWKKRYSDYYLGSNVVQQFKNIDREISRFNKLSWWKKPFVSFFSRIDTKQRLLNYFYAKELLKKTKSYCYANKTPSEISDIHTLLREIKNQAFVKNIGKYLNKFASSILSFIKPESNSDKLIDASKNSSIRPEIVSPNILSSALQKTLFDKISVILEKLEPIALQKWLGSLGIIKCWTVSNPEDEKVWKLYPLLNSNNNYIKQTTSFYLLLHALKPALFNYEEILNNALNQSAHINLAINWNVLDFRYGDHQKSILEGLLSHYPVNIKSLTLNISQHVGQDRIIKALPESISTLKVNLKFSRGEEIESSNEHCSYEFVLNSILKNLPKHITHLDLSEASLANVHDLPSVLRNIPSTVQTINISDENLLKHDDAYLARAFNALPKHFVSIKLIDKNMSEDHKIRLNNLSDNLKKTVTQNISLKNLAVNFISSYMKGTYDDKSKKLNFTHKNEDKSVSVPQDIGDIFIKKQMSIKH